VEVAVVGHAVDVGQPHPGELLVVVLLGEADPEAEIRLGVAVGVDLQLVESVAAELVGMSGPAG
jgi:hypothetical protein